MDPRDGKIYQTVKMPDDKVWFAQNLNYTKDLAYNPAADVANGAAYTSTTNGVPAIGSYWCPPLYYTAGAAITPVTALVASGNQSACEVYGALYTWETAMMVDGKYSDDTKTSTSWVEPSASYLATGLAPNNASAKYNVARGTTKRGICPAGWHVPTEYEWANLLDKVGGTTAFTTSTAYNAWMGTNEGKNLKSKSIFKVTDPGDGSWLDETNRGDNATGFGALPAGSRYNNGSQFYSRGIVATYWSSSVSSAGYAWRRLFVDNEARVHRNPNTCSYGFSVRCVRD
jgi:uncharacterized protein (TIGR02145 family)